MHTRVFSLLLVLVLVWVGFSTPAQAMARVQATPAEAPMLSTPPGAAPVLLLQQEPNGEPALPGDSSAPAQTPSATEVIADLPVVIHHGANTPQPTGTMARPGPYGPADWRSAWLDGLQRPPCSAASAA